LTSPYDSEWPAEFAALRRTYIESPGKLVLRVEHVGSTAVPNLRAKPILDIDIVMPSYDVFPDIVTRLQRLGYTHNGDQGIREREAFNPLDNLAPYAFPPRKWMSHHLYVCPANSFELRRHLVFRDALRAQDKLRQEYEQRKLEIVERSGGDRKVYAEIKEIECRDFIESVVTRNPDDTKPANLYWLVMEYVEGTTLRQLLEEGTGSITERPTLDSDV
jgi:GrpB-like predicted nucleotidyltransferase (UPF0157 family)